jgi:hypothetical protein
LATKDCIDAEVSAGTSDPAERMMTEFAHPCGWSALVRSRR